MAKQKDKDVKVEAVEPTPEAAQEKSVTLLTNGAAVAIRLNNVTWLEVEAMLRRATIYVANVIEQANVPQAVAPVPPDKEPEAAEASQETPD